MVITRLDWNADFFSERNREGIPRPTEWRFSEIFDLDYICERGGAKKMGSIRLPFGPYTTGQWEDHAETLYGTDDMLVHNSVRGKYPSRSTTVFIKDIARDHTIIDGLGKYYQGKPGVSAVDNATLEVLGTARLGKMLRDQKEYDSRDSPVRAIAALMQVLPDDQKAAAASEIMGVTRKALYRS